MDVRSAQLLNQHHCRRCLDLHTLYTFAGKELREKQTASSLDSVWALAGCQYSRWCWSDILSSTIDVIDVTLSAVSDRALWRQWCFLSWAPLCHDADGVTGCVLGVVAAGRSPHTFHIHLVLSLMLVKHAADLGWFRAHLYTVSTGPDQSFASVGSVFVWNRLCDLCALFLHVSA